jgi:hypothetical protein
MTRLARSIFAGLALCSAAAGAEAVYPRTPPGTVELKTLPRLLALETTADPADGKGDERFMRLFRYIRAHRIAMTTPVEMAGADSHMRFFVGPDDTGKPMPETREVRPRTQEPRTVVSAGVRGSYTEKNFEAGLRAARAWLERNPGWTEAGPPYGAYWSSPLVPGFRKTSEVHLPVQRTE